MGLGTWKSKKGEVGMAVKAAIDAGYCYIDCAAVYFNEKEIGKALKEKLGTACERKDIFITSKLWNTKHAAEDVRPACLETLRDLGLDYIDLYLMHTPMGYKAGDDILPKHADGSIIHSDIHYNETWGAMEKLVDEGLVKHIGLSNFNSKQIDEVYRLLTINSLSCYLQIMSVARIQPAVLQVECHPYLTQNELIAHAAKYGIVTTAYSPLGSPDRPWAKPGEPSLLDDPKIIDIAKKYNKTTAQVLIRFQMDRSVVAIPKSTKPERIKSNFDVRYFV